MRRRASLLVLAAAAVAAAGALVAGPWATADPETSAPALPTLPPIAEQVEGLYDDEGCLRLGPDEVDCSVRAEEVDEALADPGAGESRQLAGFVGPHWLDEVTGRGPVVLESTVSRSPGERFAATGLVRNESEQVLATVAVQARLLDESGQELDVVEATSPVHDVRPGEPAPFELTSPVPASAVATVTWTASGGEAGDPGRRELSWTPYWERPVGGDPVDLYFYEDPAGPRPHLLFGNVAALGDGAVGRPEVVVAWLDPAGRLRGLATAPVVGPDGDPLDELRAGAAADALVVRAEDPPAEAEAVVWVQGR